MITVTLSLDTNAYTAGDVLAATQEITGFEADGGTQAYLQSLVVIDADDQKAAVDIYLLSANVALGTENAAPNISDADAAHVLGMVSVAAADYKDLGGVSVATKTGIGLTVTQTAGAPGLWIAAVTQGTPTHSASGVKIRLGFVRAH